ncbi:MAG TPA: SRPBCC family protein [Gaiellaceae bacterium]|nr:SRPBCC family protein [Gaiellaceae bacterium]
MATEDATSEVAGGGGEAKLFSALKSKELLIPAALSAASALAASKGPDLLKKLSGEGEEQAERLGRKAAEGAKESVGGGGGVAGKVLKKAMGGGGGGGGGKKTRRLPIERWTDVAVPVDKAFEAWTKFDQFPKFMHRVLNVEQKGDDRVSWQEKIWFSKRDWEGRITDKRENELIAWKTTKGTQHKGVVSFHPLGDRLTRVMVTMEFEPTGMIEKMGSGMRFVKRAVESDLARFKAYVELADAKGIDYRPKDADEPQSRERRSQDRERDRERDDDEREERGKRREERREKARTG